MVAPEIHLESGSNETLPVCLAPWVENPYRLVSLYEMLSVYANHYVVIGANLGTIQFVLKTRQSLDPVANLHEADREQVAILFRDFFGYCGDALEMPVTKRCARHWMERFKRPITHYEASCAVNELDRVVKAELESIQFLYPPKHRVAKLDALYGPADDAEMAGVFPIANRNIKAAARCYLCSEYTASVFHVMRAVEKCLESLALRFSIDFAAIQY